MMYTHNVYITIDTCNLFCRVTRLFPIRPAEFEYCHLHVVLAGVPCGRQVLLRIQSAGLPQLQITPNLWCDQQRMGMPIVMDALLNTVLPDKV